MVQNKTEDPRHLAVIMDGNGRWAEKKGKPRLFGHKAGADCLFKLVDYVRKRTKIKAVTVFAFAVNNHKRDEDEKTGLAELLQAEVKSRTADLIASGIRARFIGDRHDPRISNEVRAAMTELEEATALCDHLRFQIAWNYSGQNEIERAQAAGWNIGDLYNSLFDAPDVGSVDLLVRTGVDSPVGLNFRQSDFLPLQSAHAVKVGTPVLWPDYDKIQLQSAITNWQAEIHLDGGQRITSIAAE